MNRWFAVVPLLALVALVAFAAVRLGDFTGRSLADGRSSEYRPDALVGQTVPETVLPMLTGATAGPGMVDLKTAGVGKPMLINVFASWCAPCKLEHPQLMALKERGVAVVGVAWKDDPAATDGPSARSRDAGWCRVFHQSTENLTIGRLIRPTRPRMAAARAARDSSSIALRRAI